MIVTYYLFYNKICYLLTI